MTEDQAYQSGCSDQRSQRRHWVEVHAYRQAGQTPPVSKVFQIWPQEHCQRSFLRGVQPHKGQRMWGPTGPSLFSSSMTSSRSVSAVGMTHLLPLIILPASSPKDTHYDWLEVSALT